MLVYENMSNSASQLEIKSYERVIDLHRLHKKNKQQPLGRVFLLKTTEQRLKIVSAKQII